MARKLHLSSGGSVAMECGHLREGMTMAELEEGGKQAKNWSAKQVYIMSAVCVLVGLAFGYLVRGTGPVVQTADNTAAAMHASAPEMPSQGAAQQQMPSLDDMKRMADKKVEPLVAQLKDDPKNVKLLVDIANAYKSAHQFAQAADYYGRALEQKPADGAIRAEAGGALYYAGDTDRAIATFQDGLKYKPNDAATLFNLGVMKLQKKNDAKGAIEMWQKLLKTNPNLPAEKRTQVQQMIAEAKQHPSQLMN